jgi:hypothetical protein
LAEKATAHKTKFKAYQKTQLNDFLVRKRKAKEEGRKDTAEHRQAVAASEQLVEMFKPFSTPPAQAEYVTVMVEGKRAAMNNDIMQEIRVKIRIPLTSILDLM